MAPRMVRLEYGLLNISAHPHPAGVYRELFERTAGRAIKYFGERKAAISAPSKRDDGIFDGNIYTWTHIDKEAQLLDTLRWSEADELQKKTLHSIPDHIGINARVFRYAFRESDHILVYEGRNDRAERLSSGSAERIFRLMFDMDQLGNLKFALEKPKSVEVHFVPEDASLEKVLAVPRLRRLEFYIALPNADDSADDADSIIAELKRQKIGSQITTIRADSQAEGIEPDKRLKAQTEAATASGYVNGEGRDEEGNKVFRSTREYPRIIKAVVEQATSTIGKLISVAKEVRINISSG